MKRHLLQDPEVKVVVEIPCASCSRRAPRRRGSGLLRYTGGLNAGKVAECIGCDGTGYEYTAMVPAQMEVPVE